MADPIKLDRTIKSIVEATPAVADQKAKPGKITFEDGTVAQYWHGTSFGAKLEVGVTALAVTQEVERAGYKNVDLKQWGAVAAKAKSFAKTPEEIHAEPVALIIAALVSTGQPPEAIPPYIEAYKAALKLVLGAPSAPSRTSSAPSAKPVAPKAPTPPAKAEISEEERHQNSLKTFLAKIPGFGKPEFLSYQHLCTSRNLNWVKVAEDFQDAYSRRDVSLTSVSLSTFVAEQKVAA